jgi:hypothetical protein
LTELKGELDAHNGTKQELADTAANLIVAHSDILDAVIDIDEARKQVFKTSVKLFAVHEDIVILEGLYRRCGFQETNEGRSVYQNINSRANGNGKFKRIQKSCSEYKY